MIAAPSLRFCRRELAGMKFSRQRSEISKRKYEISLKAYHQIAVGVVSAAWRKLYNAAPQERHRHKYENRLAFLGVIASK